MTDTTVTPPRRGTAEYYAAGLDDLVTCGAGPTHAHAKIFDEILGDCLYCIQASGRVRIGVEIAKALRWAQRHPDELAKF